ncbi:MAG TPA: phytanoyl-CoA dioxygenase family protein, partial [Bryobacteraceae bacterium]|nr:phytanoyl-CoA dioxygenase family protein [Bryobacteraceae bacterium]
MMTAEQRIQFETQGFLHIRGALDPQLLGRFKKAFDAAADKYSNRWKSGVSPQFFDIPHILDEDDVFSDLLDAPAVFPVLLGLLGGDIQLHQTMARIFPPGETFTGKWHTDLEGMNGIELGHSWNFMLKVHYYPEDLAPDQGCLAFIPGSHRYPLGHPQIQIDHTRTSAAITKIVPKAGDAVVFNVHVRHMALDNTSPCIRKSLIYSYSHFWVKNYPNAVPKDLDRLATTKERKQLFGIPTCEKESSYFHQTLIEPTLRVDVNNLLMA